MITVIWGWPVNDGLTVEGKEGEFLVTEIHERLSAIPHYKGARPEYAHFAGEWRFYLGALSAPEQSAIVWDWLDKRDDVEVGEA